MFPLRERYRSQGSIFITIFDSEEAYKNRVSSDYPESQYFKYFLATIIVNPKTGFDKVVWEAKGRTK